MAKIEIVVKDRKDELKLARALMFLIDLLDMKNKVKISLKDFEPEQVVQYLLSQIPFVTEEEQAEWERILETEPIEIDESFSHEIEI